ncbi:EAL domain-containing protein [Vibrio sp. TH_r3]|uniref:EAL domain-containing protein n=1 Tax=Vibrio sp. TH_r3 TaxID=3082084 RepID=UPI0029531E49|nr:EAL domain-containing protein [Vibrio sp. TH_r3]MDV7102931.1 EAL domain-containing protein [Vibrio sp. TH_r3]
MPQQNNSRFISMFDSAVEGLWIMDVDGKVSFYNYTFYQQFDLVLDNSTLDDWLALIHPLDQKIFSAQVDEHIDESDSEERVQSQYRVRKKDGNYCWIEATGVMKEDHSGRFMVGNHRDISEQKLLESYIKQLAYYDKASGLPNSDKLKQDLSETDSNYILVHIHLEKIKSYINQYGEDFISKILKRVIVCLKAFESYQCQYYRNSMNTFSVLIHSAISENQLADMCQQFVADFREMSRADGQFFAGDAFVGAYPCTDSNKSAEEVISWAAQTCEYAQRHEAAHWAISNREVQKKVERFFYIESKIKSAIEENEISIRLQPIVCAETFRITSFEALARWEECEIGEIYPTEFVPVAERKGLIDLLGEYVLIKACKFLSAYNKKWGSDVKMNVNVSVLQLLGGNFPQRAAEIAMECAVPANLLNLELTESVLLEDKYQAMGKIRQLKALGFNLSMDDFGSGHSSLTGFFRLPFKQLKIDRELALEATKATEPFSYLKFLNEMNQERGVSVTIEGIETEEMLHHLTKLGVNSFQGYLFSRPMKSLDALMLDNSWNLRSFS